MQCESRWCANAVERAHTKSLDANDKLIQTRPHIWNTIASRKRQVVMRKGKSTIRACASCSKMLNNKKYIFSTVNSEPPLFFRASASCSKTLNNKKYIQYSEKFQGKLCFQGKRKLLKILNVKSSVYSIQWKFSGQLCFLGKRKLHKNRELWKNVECSVYSLGGDPCNLGSCSL